MGKSVGIVTIVGNFNYGNRLQNYAVASIYHALGFESETLICPKRSLVSVCRHLAADVLRDRATARPEEVMSKKRRESFLRFSSMIPTREVSPQIDGLSDSYDFFSVGSDQVWNPNYVDSYPWVFLQFARDYQRVALAPSIGASKLSSPYARHMLAKGLRGFNKLSVREIAGARLIKELTGQDATVVIDPTLMLSPDAWRKASSFSEVPTGRYVLAYLLGSRTEEQNSYLESLKKRYGATLISLSDRSRKGEIDAGPAEFIGLIDNASHVVTDSYHAAVFSAMLQTPLTIFQRSGGSGPNLFSRLETFVEMFDASRNVYGSSSFNEDDSHVIQLDSDGRLAREREVLAKHLSESISICDNETKKIAHGIDGLL